MTINGISYRLNLWRQRSYFAMRGATDFARLQMQPSNDRPSVAAVMVGRNDDYMADFSYRLRATIAWNIRYLISEVIFVEWNPPSDRELLSVKLAEEFNCLRAYVVSPEIHQNMCQNPRLPLMEYHAKNVGIRRAKSPWIIATNADVALGLDTIQALRRSLRTTNVAWTAERVDINWQEWRQQQVGLLDCLRYRRIIEYNQLGTGDFILASREMWNRAGGYDESLSKHRIGCDARGSAQMLSHGAEIRKVGTVLHLAHPTSCTEGVKPHHGEYATLEGLPYQNAENWGLNGCREVQIAERVWRLEW